VDSYYMWSRSWKVVWQCRRARQNLPKRFWSNDGCPEGSRAGRSDTIGLSCL